MAFLSNIIGTILAFVTVMLAASLLVMCIVRSIQYVADLRGHTLGEMLGTLLHGYRSSNRDNVSPGDQHQTNFAIDVLSSPIFHTPLAMPRPRTDLSRAEADRRRLARKVEYINKDDLIEIVRQLCGASEVRPAGAGSTQDGALEISPRWHRNLPPEARGLTGFVKYIEYWFRTVEGVSSEQFKVSARRLTAVISCVLVVVLHMDAIQIATNLYSNGLAREELGRRAADVAETARRLGVGDEGPIRDRDQLLEGGYVAQVHGVLNEPDLGIGWQNSRIAQTLCVEGGTCQDGAAGRAALPLWLAIVLSVGGMGISCVLLALGAPFWLQQLQQMLNLQNSIAKFKPSRTANGTGQQNKSLEDAPEQQ